jgi:hypothetical protein
MGGGAGRAVATDRQTDTTVIAHSMKFRGWNGSVGIATSLGLAYSGFKLRYRYYFPYLLQDCWLAVSIRKVLWQATLTQVFLGFPVSKTERSDGSQHSKLPLHASYVALRTSDFLHSYFTFMHNKHWQRETAYWKLYIIIIIIKMKNTGPQDTLNPLCTGSPSRG